MKKVLFTIMALLSISLFVVGCSSKEKEPEIEPTLTVSPTDTTVAVGESFKLTSTLKPVDKDAKITFSSEDESIATVSETGTVSAVKEGKTRIIAKYGKLKGVCNVTVNTLPKMKVELAELNSTSATFKIIPPKEDMRWICHSCIKETYDGILERHGSVPASNRGWWEFVSQEEVGGENYRKAVKSESFTGTQTKRSDDYSISGGVHILPDDHEFVLTIYGIDEDGFETTEVLTKVLRTKPRVEDPNFKIDVTINNKTANEFSATIKPSDQNKQYFFDICRKRFADSYRNDKEGFIDNIPAEDYMVFNIMNSDLSYEERNARETLFRRGTIKIGKDIFYGLQEGRDYVLLVWGWDDKDGRTTDILYKDFTTPSEKK